MTSGDDLPVDGPALAVRLMERSIRYLLRTMDDVTDADLRRPTPCAQWDLGLLLQHVQDSMDALRDGLSDGRIAPVAADRIGRAGAGDEPDPVLGVRSRAGRLLAVLVPAAGADRALAIGDRVLATSTLALVGAIELAVHGWDASWAGGAHRPIPADLAVDLLMVSPLVVPAGDRRPQFTAPVTLPPAASAGDRLVAYLGRRPT